MFPLAHYYINQQIYGDVPPLLALGTLWPDLAIGCWPDNQRRGKRDAAHEMGRDFHAWCAEHHPQMLDVARGIISHGSNPHCVDYYADEFWPGYHKGRCFQLGEAYIDQVEAATGLDRNMCWWKAHNFVEMGYELLLEHKNPQLKLGLLAALHDEGAVAAASAVLAEYSGVDAGRVNTIFSHVPNTFAIATISAEELCYKQSASLGQRFNHHHADIPAMIALLEQVNRDVEQLDDGFLDIVVARTGEQLATF